ncbi:hypothetical protein FUAX_52310 (plasmid) [Fulvitalea axinellae]|uniref:Beta-N-acetylhexosaminidase n=1 Tax=Fulvitalea axinellae TaxID=1182444 RepID=A0AAU9DED5_9BACT|nr:hypothetical protein FUAX_52310 [Fulvitalea axinellae]
MKKLFLAMIALASVIFSAQAQKAETLNLMPVPKKMVPATGRFDIAPDFTVAFTGNPDQRIYPNATRFLRRLDGRSGMFFRQGFLDAGDNSPEAELIINVNRPGKVVLGENESYTLDIASGKIRLDAETDLGAMHGLETLLQLLETDDKGYFFPAMRIEDEPRFPWRGLMIDVARHYQPLDVIKRNLDGMAAVKMNVMHWHLTDDQGFRVETKSHPKLHLQASDGMFYTQKEIKEVIEYADERGIRVVPEFDVPGHATAWLITYPEIGSNDTTYTIQRYAGIFDPTLDPTNERTYEILEEVFSEIAPLFPDAYFHIGGDENEGKHWDANEKIQAFMKSNNLKDNHALQTHFNKRLLTILEKLDKKMMGWDEILQPALPKTAVIQSWRGLESLHNAAKGGYMTLLSNGFYIDVLKPASHHYATEPLPEGHGLTPEQTKNIVGGEATMWSELVTPTTIDSRIWPRTIAIAERLWSPAKYKDARDMYRRLEQVSFRLEELGLTHIRNRQVILRNIANNQDISALEVLANVSEPLKGYTRNKGGTEYESYSPFTLFADACTVDAPDALAFKMLTEDYIQSPNKETKKQLLAYLSKWENNHENFVALTAKAPYLKKLVPHSENLRSLAQLGTEALTIKARPKKAWKKEAEKTLEKGKKPGEDTELIIQQSIEKLVQRTSKLPKRLKGSSL